MLPFVSMEKWNVANTYVKIAFLKIRLAYRDVYSVPHSVSTREDNLWLMPDAEYGIVDVNTKWKIESDQLQKSPGLEHVSAIPQLFMKKSCLGSLIHLALKSIEHSLATGLSEEIDRLVNKFDATFKHGTICKGPFCMLFF